MMAIFKRELRSYFQNPAGYVFLGLFLLVSGLMFSFGNVIGRSSDFPGLVGSIHFLLVITVPILTMRSFSEELRQKTDQLLLTSPVSVGALVVGKYLASLVVFLIVALVTVSYAVTIAIFGDLAISQSAGAIAGFILAGGCYIAIGIFISTLTDSQAVAAVGTFTALLLLQMVEYVRAGLPRNEVLVLVDGLLGLFSIARRHQHFVDGIVALDDIVYMLSAVFMMLFLSVRSIEKRR